MVEIRTRMAPSPTGEFHIGGMRTLLYNWAWAKKNNGKFIIRIEDTDRARLVGGATERLLNVIKEYGFDWDEGPVVGGLHAPYIQSERLDIYKKYANQLIDQGKAYYCFCTPERLDKMREEQKKKGIASTKYDRHCLNLSKDEIEDKLKTNTSYVVRLKVPENQDISWVDGVVGKVTFNSNEIDDQILLKSDGFPTYHLGVVVDDHLMEITHIMRGNEWLPSTPKHILLYEAFGWEPPIHLHLPNLKEIGSTKKLSKRHGPVAAQAFLEDGFLPEAIVNYLMFLGWNPGTEKEIYSLDEFVQDFDLAKIHKTDLVAFDRVKLEWFNAQYIKSLSDEEFAERVLKFAPSGVDKNLIVKIAPLVKDRIKKLTEFSEIASFFFETPEVDKELFTEDANNHLKTAISVLENIEKWEKEVVDTELLKEIEKNEYKTGKFFMDLRVALAGKKVTPPINDSLIILGKAETIKRLQSFVS